MKIILEMFLIANQCVTNVEGVNTAFVVYSSDIKTDGEDDSESDISLLKIREIQEIRCDDDEEKDSEPSWANNTIQGTATLLPDTL